ncbi:MAG: NUDIX domain-containing protein [Planctomycetaceae bacterium]|nr:NUDIX domain-containing protein [Planctomycetaceae bacterium]
MLISAGTLLYRLTNNTWEVLLVHPSGHYNRNAAWSIPKGLPDAGESLEATARRETFEETGVLPNHLVPLGTIQYRSKRKQVHCFLGLVDESCFPTCACWEVDQVEFVSLKRAYRLLHVDQIPFLDRLVEKLRNISSKAIND